MSPAVMPSIRARTKRCTGSGIIVSTFEAASSVGLPLRYLGIT